MPTQFFLDIVKFNQKINHKFFYIIILFATLIKMWGKLLKNKLNVFIKFEYLRLVSWLLKQIWKYWNTEFNVEPELKCQLSLCLKCCVYLNPGK